MLELLLRGAKVAALDIRDESLAGSVELANAGDRLAMFPLGVTDREATAASVDQVVAALGPVDGLVDVAGIMQPWASMISNGTRST